MCDCINTFNESLHEHNVGVESQTVMTWVEGVAEGIRTERVKLATYKVEPSSKRKPGVFPTFCPFCGERYVSDAAA